MFLVTGGAGFIGSHLVERLLAAGKRVRVIDNLSTGRIESLQKSFLYRESFEFIQGDINDLVTLDKAMCGINAIVHLAAQVSVQDSMEYPLNSAHQNIMGFLRVLEFCRKFGVKRIVYASSAAIYGRSTEIPLDEDVSPKPISPYGIEKLTNEFYAKLYTDLYGLNCVGLRFFNVYGPRQDPNSSYAGVISKFMRNAERGLPLKINGDGFQTRDFVHVFDVAKVCEIALSSSCTGIICVGTGKSVTIRRLTEVIGSVVGLTADIVHGDPVVGDILFSSMNPDRCHRYLGFKPNISLEDGLKTLWMHMKSGY